MRDDAAQAPHARSLELSFASFQHQVTQYLVDARPERFVDALPERFVDALSERFVDAHH